ncbi:FAD-dependent monooxygenase [Vreelandella nigrificans]|uniref:FAD-binding domain-containing protein n=1 Tax=Vreelandella nigrificans TaxID=2042704 RepID=A0A2A4HLZ5_9GAMM|nr:FAD-dependent monooxygenase [Halomonas nigrificans]PCF95776.1 hypothetical protein CPA45_10350 [Halomonas nigrificans]
MKQVLIVGAGPVGLTLGTLLCQYGVECVVMEKGKSRLSASKAFSLHARTVEMLKLLNADIGVDAKAVKVEEMRLYSRHNLLSKMRFGKSSNTECRAIHSYPQNLLESELETAFCSHGGLIEKGTKVFQIDHQPHGYLVHYKYQDEVKSQCFDYVVGCDGANSIVRQLVNINSLGCAYSENFLVADCKIESMSHSFDYQKHGHTFLSSKGYAMLFPIGQDYTRIVIDTDRQYIGESESENLAYLNSELEARGFSAHIDNVKWISVANVRSSLVSKYSVDNIILAGDACHIHSPVGGQGLNTGIQDAFNLAWRLAFLIKSQGSSALLRDYEYERRAVAKRVLKMTNSMHNMFVTKSKARAFVRDFIIRKVQARTSVNNKRIEQLSGYAIAYQPPKNLSNGIKYAGKRIGNISFCTGPRTQNLYNALREGKFVLVMPGTKELDKTAIEKSLGHLSNWVKVLIASDFYEKLSLYTGPQKASTPGFSNYLLVRPDAYIAGMVTNHSDLKQSLETMLTQYNMEVRA